MSKLLFNTHRNKTHRLCLNITKLKHTPHKVNVNDSSKTHQVNIKINFQTHKHNSSKMNFKVTTYFAQTKSGYMS